MKSTRKGHKRIIWRWDHLMAMERLAAWSFHLRAPSIKRIEGGILGNGTDLTPDMTPFERT